MKALAALGSRLPRTLGHGRQATSRLLRSATALAGDCRGPSVREALEGQPEGWPSIHQSTASQVQNPIHLSRDVGESKTEQPNAQNLHFVDGRSEAGGFERTGGTAFRAAADAR